VTSKAGQRYEHSFLCSRIISVAASFPLVPFHQIPVMIFSSFFALSLSAGLLVDAANPRLLASRAQMSGVVASGPVSPACIGIIPGTGSDPGVVS
jgi:hypothetical protein